VVQDATPRAQRCMRGAMNTDRAAPRASRDQLVAMTPPVIRQTLPMVP
jgi:hypothetical protein